MTLRERAWGLGLAALRPLLPAAGLLGPKAAAASAGRRGAAASLERWARARPPSSDGRPLWLHGASAGELLGTVPVLSRLRERRPLHLLVTYVSPSAEAALPALDPRGADFLPLDTAGDCRRALRAVRPSALVFAKGDLWPNLTRVAADAGVPVGMINATLAPDSSRLLPGVRSLLRPGHRRLSRVGAATGQDAERLRRLGVAAEALEVTGDAAVDRALAESTPPEATADGPARRLEGLAPAGRPVLVAGSTWPADEELILETVAGLRDRGGPPSPFLVLVPHEPGSDARERIRAACRERLGTKPAVWAEDGPPEPGEAREVLVVNRTGILSRIYAAADLAWVGGGLGGDGLHSVVEPAAAGVPVLFGPRGSRWEARELLDRGAARRLSPDAGPDALAGFVSELLAETDLRRSMGRAARAFVRDNAGAAERGARLVAELLDGPGAGRR